MKIRLINYGESCEIFLEGRLDGVTALETEEIFKDAAARFDRVVLDFERLEYITSWGLRILRNLHMDMKKKSGDLAIRNVGEMVMGVFEMTGYVSMLHFI